MKYNITKNKKILNVTISGPFNFEDSEAFFPIVKEIRAYDGLELCFDLSDCTFIDSAGVGMLMIAAKDANQRNIQREIKAAPKAIREILTIAKVSNFYKMTP